MDILVDGHLDLAYNAVVLSRDLLQPVSTIRAQDQAALVAEVGSCTTSFPALKDGHVAIVGASLFVEPHAKLRPTTLQTYRTPQEAHTYARMQLDYYHRVSDEEETLTIIHTAQDLDGVIKSGEGQAPRIGMFIVMEGAEPITDIDDLERWVDAGVRGIALTWAAGTRYAGGNGNPGPLTADGRRLLHAMGEHNLLLDISHLWEDAADTALDLYPGPVVASHANPRHFVESPRMLSDSMIRRVAERDGVIGAVAYNRHLDAQWRPGEPRLPLSKMVEVIDHVCQVTGDARCACIGSDLDGGFGWESTLAELDTVADLSKLRELLTARGYGTADVSAILSGNWLRVMRVALSAF